MIRSVSQPPSHPWPHRVLRRIVRVDDVALAKDDEALRSLVASAAAPGQRELCAETTRIDLAHALLETRKGPLGVRLRVGDSQLAEVHRRRRQLARPGFVLVLERAEKALGRAVQFIGTLGVHAEIDLSLLATQSDESVEDVLQRVLLSPLVKMPLQPLFGLLRVVMEEPRERAPGPQLWDLVHERLGADFYITDEGELTLSRRWRDWGETFGGLAMSPAELRESALFGRLDGLEQSLFERDVACTRCPRYGVCGGFFKAYDPEQDCNGFLTLMAGLETHRPHIEQSYSQLLPVEQQRLAARFGGAEIARSRARRVQGEQVRRATTVFRAATVEPGSQDAREQLESLKDMVLEAALNGVEHLTLVGRGCDALGLRQLGELARTARAHGILRLSVVTHEANLATTALQHLVDASVDTLVVPVYGIGDVHDRMASTPGAYEALCGTLPSVAAQGLQLQVHTPLLRSNVHQLGQLLSISESWGAGSHVLRYNAVAASAQRLADDLPDYAELRAALARIPWSRARHAWLLHVPRCVAPATDRHMAGRSMGTPDLAPEPFEATWLAACGDCHLRADCSGVDNHRANLQPERVREHIRPPGRRTEELRGSL